MSKYPDLDLQQACRAGDVSTVKRLLAEGVTPNLCDVIGGYSPLQVAATRGYLEIVNALVVAGANINRVGGDVPGSALCGAVIAGHTAVVRYLLEHGADPTVLLQPHEKPLVDEAQENGFVDIVSLLRQYQAKHR